MATLSRRLSRALLSNSNPKPFHANTHFSAPFCTTTTTTDHPCDSDLEDSEPFLSDSESATSHSSPSNDSNQRRAFRDPILENGLDMGVYKAIVVGKVGRKPVQKKLKSGLTLTVLPVGTGGIRNSQRPLENESPKEYADCSAIQWHRVCIYPRRLGDVVMKNAVPG